jgi:hypothetical protein
MDILPFYRISKPVLETGVTANLKPCGFWQPRVIRPDGTIRLPFGDNWIENHITNDFWNGFLSDRASTKGSFFTGSGTSTIFESGSFASLFATYWRVSDAVAWPIWLEVGTGTAPSSNADTTLTNAQIRAADTPGNGAFIDPLTGDIKFTLSQQWAPAPAGGQVWTEAGMRRGIRGGISTGAQGHLGATYSSSVNQTRLQARVVFPAPIAVNEGEILVLTWQVVVPTLAVSGIPITVSSKLGMNISGLLKVVGTSTALIGGTVTNDGLITQANSNFQHPLISDFTPSHAGLSALTSHAAYNTASAALSGNDIAGVWQPYTTNSRGRSMMFTWPIGTPATDTMFRSITIYRNNTSPNNTSGYQLLLDNAMTKVANASLVFTFHWQF